MISFFLAVPAIVWLLLSGLFNALGEYLSRTWGDGPSLWLAAGVALAYVFSSLLWLPALLHQNQLSTVGVAWILIALISTLFLGLVVFDEPISKLQMVGLCFAAISVAFLLW